MSSLSSNYHLNNVTLIHTIQNIIIITVILIISLQILWAVYSAECPALLTERLSAFAFLCG